MDEVVQTYVRDKTFMGTVLVARDGVVMLSKGYGSANLEWDIPNTPATKFRLGSITKQFTAASILLLEERGKLKLDDPIKKHMPDAPAAWDTITIFNLLTHTSGIPNFTSLPEYKTLQLVETPVARTIATVRDKPLDFVPGEKMSYSNSGYLVLGYVIERITGASYAKFVTDNIFTPLGMKDSGYDSNTAIIPRRAAGYTPSPAGLVNAGFVHMSIPHAAGALYSTTEDLLRWEQGLFGGKLISAASLAKMTTPFKSDYAFGVMVQTANGRKVVQHGGGIEGFNTFLAYYPDDKLTVAVLANINGNTPDADCREAGHAGARRRGADHVRAEGDSAADRNALEICRHVRTGAGRQHDDQACRRSFDDAADRSGAITDLRGVGDEVLPEGRGRAGRVLHRRERDGHTRCDVTRTAVNAKLRAPAPPWPSRSTRR